MWSKLKIKDDFRGQPFKKSTCGTCEVWIDDLFRVWIQVNKHTQNEFPCSNCILLRTWKIKVNDINYMIMLEIMHIPNHIQNQNHSFSILIFLSLTFFLWKQKTVYVIQQPYVSSLPSNSYFTTARLKIEFDVYTGLVVFRHVVTTRFWEKYLVCPLKSSFSTLRIIDAKFGTSRIITDIKSFPKSFFNRKIYLRFDIFIVMYIYHHIPGSSPSSGNTWFFPQVNLSYLRIEWPTSVGTMDMWWLFWTMPCSLPFGSEKMLILRN